MAIARPVGKMQIVTSTRRRRAVPARRLAWLSWTVAAFVLSGSTSLATLHAEDNANRTLFGNQAVRKELALSAEQQEKIDAILQRMEKEIEVAVALAKVEAGKDGKVDEEAIAGILIQEHGPKAQAVLDEKQVLRLWQIGAQASGVGVFGNNRTQRVLRLTVEQRKQMRALQEAMVKDVTKLATDPTLDIATIRQKADERKQDLYDKYVELLTPQQQKDLRDLLGEPFDPDLLANSAGTKPRSLTFVFGISAQNSHVLLADPKTQQQLGLTEEQIDPYQALMKHEDEQLTAVRLGTLKALKSDFRELDAEEQDRAARTILDGAAKIFAQTNAGVIKILSPRQVEQFDARLVQEIGVRALGSDRIAERLGLSAKQKQAFAAASAEFEHKTATLRVVSSTRRFDSRRADELQKMFEATARALLTAEQAEKLEKFRSAD